MERNANKRILTSASMWEIPCRSRGERVSYKARKQEGCPSRVGDYKNTHEPIIDEETFDKVQKERIKRQKVVEITRVD